MRIALILALLLLSAGAVAAASWWRERFFIARVVRAPDIAALSPADRARLEHLGPLTWWSCSPAEAAVVLQRLADPCRAAGAGAAERERLLAACRRCLPAAGPAAIDAIGIAVEHRSDHQFPIVDEAIGRLVVGDWRDDGNPAHRREYADAVVLLATAATDRTRYDEATRRQHLRDIEQAMTAMAAWAPDEAGRLLAGIAKVAWRAIGPADALGWIERMAPAAGHDPDAACAAAHLHATLLRIVSTGYQRAARLQLAEAEAVRAMRLAEHGADPGFPRLQVDEQVASIRAERWTLVPPAPGELRDTLVILERVIAAKRAAPAELRGTRNDYVWEAEIYRRLHDDEAAAVCYRNAEQGGRSIDDPDPAEADRQYRAAVGLGAGPEPGGPAAAPPGMPAAAQPAPLPPAPDAGGQVY